MSRRVDGPDQAHRFDDLNDETIEALGLLGEALETVERARGHLYSFHQLTGTADFALERAATALRAAGHQDLAEYATRELVGRNVLDGRWTFQIVEEYDDDYWAALRNFDAEVRGRLAGGRRHLREARMKEERRSHGRPHHEGRPAGQP